MKDIEQKAPKVEARTVKGCQDLFPEDMIPRKKVIRAIEDVFEKYGFLPIETPALEHLETLLGAGGEETNKELFRLESPEGEPIALRFDMTVPFARLLAQYPDKLKTPFRRYACGPVWRADKPGPGRFRQFTQFDIDAAGSESVAVDAEIVAIMTKVMRTRAVGVKDFTVLVNNRKVVDALLYGHNVRCPARHRHVLRVVDKLAKVGLENVRLELGEGRIDESGDPIPGVKLDAETIDGLLAFLAIEADTRRGVVDAMAAALPPSEQTTAALTEMEELASSLDALGVDEKYALFSPSLTRGLDYYTGPVFETILPNAPEFGAVMGGGRYNQLVARFLDEAIPCTGMSIGLDRLMAARQHGKITADLACTLDDVKSSSTAYTGVAARQHGKITVDLARTLGDVKLSSTAHTGVPPAAKTTVQALIMTLGNVAVSEAMQIAAKLRKKRIRTEVYFGAKRSLKAQLSHADRFGIPVAVILGEDELAKGMVSVKDLMAGKQQRADIADHDAYRQAGKTAQVTIPLTELIETVKSCLKSRKGH